MKTLKPSPELDPIAVKARSENLITDLGGRICDWLPTIELTEARDLRDIGRRALVLNAVLQIGFNAPPEVISDWLARADLAAATSQAEQRVLALSPGEIDRQLQINLTWRVEALWALMWVAGRVQYLDATNAAGDSLAGMFPSIRDGELPGKFFEHLAMRSYDEIYEMRDLHYRLHWLTREGRLRNQSTAPFSDSIVSERRWALEWALDASSEWDDVDLST